MRITSHSCLAVALIRHARRCHLPARCEPSPRVVRATVVAPVVRHIEYRRVFVSATPQVYRPALPFNLPCDVGVTFDMTA